MRNLIQFFKRIWIWNAIQENRIGQKQCETASLPQTAVNEEISLDALT
jgi:hypothetical protein